MSIIELIEKAKISASKRSKEERTQLLIDAHILDRTGQHYDEKYFSKETVKRSKDKASNNTLYRPTKERV